MTVKVKELKYLERKGPNFDFQQKKKKKGFKMCLVYKEKTTVPYAFA